LDDERCCDLSLAGGKGASLATLLQKGFAVPAGMVVTTPTYEAFLAGSAVEAGAFLDPGKYGLARLRNELAQSSLPRGLHRELAHNLRQCASDQHFAVRSSSTFEDLAESAFAGMHGTWLNCFGLEDILERVRTCYCSLWSDEAVAYREHGGFAHRDAGMAVVIQAMVPCEVAGVGFSVHPVTGDPERLVINANVGLGESVVNGQHEVDHFEVDRATLTLKESILGRKQTKIVCDDERGGVREEKIDATDARNPSLSERQLVQVATLLREVDEACGFPQDIEWGIAGSHLHLLQSRPVTRIPARWTRDESAERFPDVITPLTWDIVERGFHESLAYSFELMGLPPYHGKWFQCHGSYIYGNQNAVALYLQRAPLVVSSLDQLRTEIPRLRNKFRWVQDLPVQWSRDLDGFLLKVGRLAAQPVEEWEDLGQIWDQVQELVRTGNDYFMPNIAISITQAKLHQVLFSLLNLAVGEREAPRFFDGLMSFCETRTWEINRELFELARTVGEDPALEKLLLDHPAREIIEADRLEEFPLFAAHFEQFLHDHGHRELDFDAYHPTWIEVPWIVLDNIRLLLRSRSRSEQESPIAKERELRVCMHEAESELFRRLPEDLHFFFRELLRLTRLYTSLDDREHYQTTRLAPPLRRALRAIGTRLVRRGFLENAMDIFFARLDDLEAAVEANCQETWTRLAVDIDKNKATYLRDKERRPEQVLGESEPVAASGGGLRGIPGSPGVAEGPVYHVRSQDDFAAFPEGAILVARTTSPAWTPLFYSAAGVVTESGGPLSHGAVVARELHLPAVMAVRSALCELSNGVRVRIDGTRGLVTIVEEQS
jgi:pyruvate,water dikinase